jgi:hypothetical protein
VIDQLRTLRSTIDGVSCEVAQVVCDELVAARRSGRKRRDFRLQR